MKHAITLRKTRPGDEAFLYRVFASTRPDIALMNAGEEEKSRLMKMQFRAQSNHYHTHFADAEYLIVLKENEPIGRLYVHRRPDEIRVMDIAILPEHRGQGIGTQLMLDILREGRVADKPVRIHVDKTNAALRLYGRLGFVKIGEKEFYYFMECAPGQREVSRQ